MYTWKPIYAEIAQALRKFKDDRTPLVEWIYSSLSEVKDNNGKSLIGYLHEKDKSNIKDIDPFSVFAIFNRGISDENRKQFLLRFKTFLNLKSDIPTDYDGIPVMNALRSFFFSWENDKEEVMENLWSLYIKALNGEPFEKEYDFILGKGGVKYSCSMALFWICPDKYLALDSNSRTYLAKYGIPIKSVPKYNEYLQIIDTVKKKIDDGTIPYKSFCDLSYIAWSSNKVKDDDDANSQAPSKGEKVWLWMGDEKTFESDKLKAGSFVSGNIKDFSVFKTKQELRKECQKALNNTDVSIADAYWKFMNNVSPNDIVIVFSNKHKQGKNHHIMYGWGRIASDIIYSPNEKEPIQREVEWHRPILDKPIIDATVRNSLFFHGTTPSQAAHLIGVLGIEKTDTISNTSKPNYWLAGFSFYSTDSQMERFVEEGIWEGSGDTKTNELINQVSVGDVLILKSTATKGKGHSTPFLKTKGLGIIESNCREEMNGLFSFDVRYINTATTDEKEFSGSEYGKYRKTFHKCDNKHIIEWADSLLNNSDKENPLQYKDLPKKYQESLDLLKSNRNIVLTGAPGTGKTFMAKIIAQTLANGNDNAIESVQFHPSFDYTDFVEGLRPIKEDSGSVSPGFERKDGVFKEFCKKAAKNLNDSLKTQETLSHEKSLDERIESFLSDAIDNKKEFQIKTGNKFSISGVENGRVKIESPENKVVSNIDVPVSEIRKVLEADLPLNNVKEIRMLLGRQYGYQQDSYTYVICREIKKLKVNKTTKVDSVKLQNYVFIIDEINRGDLSKIFGELFFSIDPGYRGTKGKVKTQYQNLLEDDDLFHDGFYVPENVYVIATMNDIDRSVESMDFAMRRRFTWIEVTPEDTQDEILKTLNNKAQTIEVMERLNSAISATEGLGPAFNIGPAYFLKLENYANDFSKLWNLNLRPLLKEYLRGFRKAGEILKLFEDVYFGKKKADKGEDADTGEDDNE